MWLFISFPPRLMTSSIFSWPYWPFLSSFCQMYVEIFFALLFYLIIIDCVCAYSGYFLCLIHVLWIFFPVSGLPFLFLNGAFKKKKKLSGVLHLCYTYRFGENCHLNIIESWYIPVLFNFPQFCFAISK